MSKLPAPQAPGKNSSKAAKHSPTNTGVFPHARWRRRRAFDVETPRNAYQSARSELARLETAAILERHEAITRHTHARWSPRDRATHDELVSRCWGMGEISSLRMVGLPRWVEPMLSKVSPTGRRMARPGWRPFLALVIGAFRGGSAGVRLTLDELAAELGPSRTTCARYVGELIEAGLLRRIKVMREVTGAKIKRANDANVYQPGPVLLANWHAILEGCSSRVKYGGPNAKRAKFAAHELRQDARQYRRARELAARESHPSPELPGKLRRADVEGHEADDQGHNADAWLAHHRATTHATPPPPPPFTPAELDELDAELERATLRRLRRDRLRAARLEEVAAELDAARLSAQRSSVGAADDAEPVALAKGRGAHGAGGGVSVPKYQSGLTTRSRSKTATPPAPGGPRPFASATGSEFEAAPTLERCALCRGDTVGELDSGSRCSHSCDEQTADPWPLGKATSVPRTPPQESTSKAPATSKPGHPLGALPPAPRIKPEPPQPATRGDNLRATTHEDEGAEPSTGAGYDWRRALREHAARGGSLRFLDPKLRAELGFEDDQ